MTTRSKKAKTVKLIDLTKTTQEVYSSYLKAIGRFLKKGDFVLSYEVEDFEKKWVKYCGVKFAVGVSSGADALHLSLRVLGVGEGDEVITSGNAYNASVTAILRCGATPRFSDIDPDTLCIDTKSISKLINKKTKAILPVHLYGQMNDMEEIMKIARRHKLFVVEDSAQAHGAKIGSKKAGSFGDLGCFSFYPTKNLGAYGDAGAVVTNDVKLYKKLLSLRNLGQTSKNNHTELGYNMRLDSIQAIALSLKLPSLDSQNASRVRLAKYYDSEIKKHKLPISPINIFPKSKPVYHLYVVKVEDYSRDLLVKKLKEAGVGSAVHYPELVFNQPFFKKAYKNTDRCPEALKVSKQIISLPMYPSLTQREVDVVINSLIKILK